MKVLLFSLLGVVAVYASEAVVGAIEKQPLNMSAISMFLTFVIATLGITYWAAKRTKSTKDFYSGADDRI